MGRGCGAVIGGIIIDRFGTKVTFFSYGVLSLIVMIGFIIINKFLHKATLSNQPDQLSTTNNVNVDVNCYPNEMETSNIEDNNNENYYYDHSSTTFNNDKNASFMPVFSPHGVPSSNQLWIKKN